jgi:hypothetical protein
LDGLVGSFTRSAVVVSDEDGRILPREEMASAADPLKLHGPYWHLTAKVEGKTVNRRLDEREASLYTEWIDNDRKARALLSEMREAGTVDARRRS